MNTFRPTYYPHLGLVATHRRKIDSGLQYDRYFPKPDGENVMLNQFATVFDTLDQVVIIIKKTLGDTSKIAQKLKKGTTKDTLKAIFDFAYSHIQYDKDKEGVEQLRRPARSWSDRKSGIDCDCFSVFVGSILTNLKIPHYFRIIKRNYASEYSHIYVIVPKSNKANLSSRNDYWVIDPVLDRFDKEADSITQKHDKMGSIPLEYLNGLSGVQDFSSPFGQEFEGLGGLGELSAGLALTKALKQHLVNTRKALRTHPKNRFLNKRLFDKGLGYAIQNWDDPILRDNALARLSAQENRMMNVQAIHGLLGYSGLYGLEEDPEVNMILNGDDDMSGLGKAKKGFFAKVRNVVKNAGQKVATVAKKVGKTAGQVAKKVGKAIAKVNPLSVSIRAGFLLACAINFAGMSKKLMYGYMTKDQAAKKGVPADTWQRSKSALDQLENLWVKVLAGDKTKLKGAILSGKRKNILNGMAPSYEGLGNPVALAPAMAFIAKIGAIISKAFKGVSKVVDIVDQGKDAAQSAKEALQLNQYAEQNPGAGEEFNQNFAPTPGTETVSNNTQAFSNPSMTNTGNQAITTINPNDNGVVNANAVSIQPDNPPYQETVPAGEEKKSGGGSAALIIGGLLLGGLLLAGGKKGKKSGMNGAEEDKAQANLAGAGRRKGRGKSKSKAKRSRSGKRRKTVTATI